MRTKLWNFFIVGLLLLLTWAFYFYWTSPNKKVEENKINTVNIENEKLVAKESKESEMDEYNKKYSEMLKKVASKDRRGELEKEEEKMIQDLNEITFLTVEEVAEKTEEIYDELLPSTLNSDIETMDLALNELDIKADEIEEKLLEEEESMDVIEIDAGENLEETNFNVESIVQNDVLPDVDSVDIDDL